MWAALKKRKLPKSPPGEAVVLAAPDNVAHQQPWVNLHLSEAMRAACYFASRAAGVPGRRRGGRPPENREPKAKRRERRHGDGEAGGGRKARARRAPLPPPGPGFMRALLTGLASRSGAFAAAAGLLPPEDGVAP